MFKLLKICIFCLLAAFLVWFGTVLADRQDLNDNVIRFHVVANSDSQEDQAVKLQIRDTVMDYLEPIIGELPTAEEAKAWLQAHLEEIKEIADAVLKQHGFSQTASVSLRQEAFDTRFYDTFTMPAGTYDALRITVGEGQGQNWWCVVFPPLCLASVTEETAATAAAAGLGEDQVALITGQDGSYVLKFKLLEWWNSLFPS